MIMRGPTVYHGSSDDEMPSEVCLAFVDGDRDGEGFAFFQLKWVWDEQGTSGYNTVHFGWNLESATVEIAGEAKEVPNWMLQMIEDRIVEAYAS